MAEVRNNRSNPRRSLSLQLCINVEPVGKSVRIRIGLGGKIFCGQTCERTSSWVAENRPVLRGIAASINPRESPVRGNPRVNSHDSCVEGRDRHFEFTGRDLREHRIRKARCGVSESLNLGDAAIVGPAHRTGVVEHECDFIGRVRIRAAGEIGAGFGEWRHCCDADKFRCGRRQRSRGLDAERRPVGADDRTIALGGNDGVHRGIVVFHIDRRLPKRVGVGRRRCDLQRRLQRRGVNRLLQPAARDCETGEIDRHKRQREHRYDRESEYDGDISTFVAQKFVGAFSAGGMSLNHDFVPDLWAPLDAAQDTKCAPKGTQRRPGKPRTSGLKRKPFALIV